VGQTGNERQRCSPDDQRHRRRQAQPVRDVVQGDHREQHRDHQLEQVDGVHSQVSRGRI
jgi:hypothetical protein